MGLAAPRPLGDAESMARARRSLGPKDVKGTLLEGQSLETLRLLGLVTERGGASADAHRKLKQVSHFLRLIAPAVEDVFARHEEPVLLDLAAGKAYLGFAIYEHWIARLGRGRLVAVERQPEQAEKMRRIAERAGFGHFEVVETEILAAPLPERAHFALALHACDVATDHAIARGLGAKSDHLAVVPCCQAEVGALLKQARGGPSMLWRHAWHRREFGAHLTNVMRALALEARGYQVTVTELAGWEHSLKNELILGRRVGAYHEGARAQLAGLVETFGVRPWLVAALDEAAP